MPIDFRLVRSAKNGREYSRCYVGASEFGERRAATLSYSDAAQLLRLGDAARGGVDSVEVLVVTLIEIMGEAGVSAKHSIRCRRNIFGVKYPRFSHACAMYKGWRTK